MKRRQKSPSPGPSNAPNPSKLPKISTHKYSKKPQLCSAAIDEFLEYSKEEYFDDTEWLDDQNNFTLFYLLISKRFCKKVQEIDGFDLGVGISLNDEDPEDSDPSALFQIKQHKKPEDLNKLLLFLNLFEHPLLGIHFGSENDFSEELDKNLIQTVSYFCRKIKDIPSLKEIHANFINFKRKPRKSTVSIFIDLLPSNKKLSIKTPHDISLMTQKRQEPLDVVGIFDMRFQKCTAQIFKTKTEELYFTHNKYPLYSIPKLHHLHKIGPFSPNPTLKKFAIDLDLTEALFHPGVRGITRKDWDEKFLPWCQKSFEYLKTINENLELQLDCEEKMMIENISTAILHYNEIVKRAKSLIDSAKNVNLKISEFTATKKFEFFYRFVDIEKNSNEFVEKTQFVVFEEYQEDDKYSKKTLTTFIEHCGSIFRINIEFLPRRIEYATKAANFRAVMAHEVESDEEDEDEENGEDGDEENGEDGEGEDEELEEEEENN